MNWRVVVRPEAREDVVEAAAWYDTRGEGLGDEFVEAVLGVFDELEQNPLLECRRDPIKNVRWRYPKRFPYRVIYEVIEEKQVVVIASVLHGARHDRNWQSRI